MIHSLSSSLATFKRLEFRPGLNVLLAEKEKGASAKQTRNRAGKSSLVEIVHFLLGSEAKAGSLCVQPALREWTFELNLDLAGVPVRVSRTGGNKSKVIVDAPDSAGGTMLLSNSDWSARLGCEVFGLKREPKGTGRAPTFRSLLPYFARRQSAHGFNAPEQHADKQQAVEQEMGLLFLLGLDWRIASDWQSVRDRENTLKELKKAAMAGDLGTVVGKTAVLRTELTLVEDQLARMQGALKSFQVLPQFREFEREANELTRALNALSDADVADNAALRDLDAALTTETPPAHHDLDQIYLEAGVALPGLALRRYDEVYSFHQSVVRNRRDYLQEERESAVASIAERNQVRAGLDARRKSIMQMLHAHGALDQFAELQAAFGKLGAQAEALRQRFAAAQQLESTKARLELERHRLVERLRRNFDEQDGQLRQAIKAFQETSKRLYESAGSMTIDVTSNGPKFDFPMQGSRSKGIKNMQIFCFDMMLMRLCAARGIGPGFLIHDSHLFDGVDGRQIASALKVGAETAKELGFQYIVTLNDDDAFKEASPDFNLADYVLPVRLTDAREDGGLFGVRF